MKQEYGLTHGRPYPQSPIPHICSNDQTLCLIFQRKYLKYPKIYKKIYIQKTLDPIPHNCSNLRKYIQNIPKKSKISLISTIRYSQYPQSQIILPDPQPTFPVAFSFNLLKQPSPIINPLFLYFVKTQFSFSKCFLRIYMQSSWP